MSDNSLDNMGTQLGATSIKGRKAMQASRIVSVKARHDMRADGDVQVVEMSDATVPADVLKIAKMDPPAKTELSRTQTADAQAAAVQDGGQPAELANKSSEMKAHKATAVANAARAGRAEDKIELPATEDLRDAYEKVSYRDRLRRSIVSTTNILIVVAAVAVLTAMLFLPVLRIYGHSMNNTLESGELVLSLKGASFKTGDIIAFYYNNNILVKRVIANSGDWVDIDLDGNVYVNQQKVEEPYLKEKAFGEPDIDFPYQVPEDRVFVLGDNRAVSVDSRSKAMGCVSSEQIVGKVVFRIWPLNRLGSLK